MAAALLYLPANRAFNSNGLGVPGAVAKLYTTGTLTPQNFYSNSALSVSLGATITANGAGRFAPAYQDETVPFRLVIEDSAGVELDDIDPYYFGSLYGSVVGTSQATVATRTALAQLTGTAGASCKLTEDGRDGDFKFFTAAAYLTAYGVALTAAVTADTLQGVHVAPTSDTTGASGAWVRKYSGPLDIRWFGAVADCTAIGTGTNNAAAINGAIAVAGLSKGAEILVPRGNLGFRVGSTLTFTGGVKIRGQGFSQSPTATYPTPPQHIKGSMLVFDANVAGLKFLAYTDHAANAQVVQYEGASYSVIEDIFLYGGGGTTVTAYGLETRTILHAKNVRIDNFAGEGIRVDASTAGTGNYGNANRSKFDHCYIANNLCHGAHLKGTDANGITFDTCEFSTNGGLGVLDDTSTGGNHYNGCLFELNNQSFGTVSNQRTQVTADFAGLSDTNLGSIAFTNTGNTPHTITQAYVEDATGKLAHLPVGTIVVGGLLANSGYWDATSQPVVIDGFANTIRVGKIQPPGAVGTPLVLPTQIALTADIGTPSASSNALLNWSSNGGLMMAGAGASQDLTVFNKNSLSVFYINTGTRDVNFQNNIAVVGAITGASLAIGGGTALTKAVVYAPTITPASVAAATVAEQTFTVSGLTTADKVIVNPPAIANATGVAGARVSAADTLAIRFVNPTAGALTPTSGVYTVIAWRS